MALRVHQGACMHNMAVVHHCSADSHPGLQLSFTCKGVIKVSLSARQATRGGGGGGWLGGTLHAAAVTLLEDGWLRGR